MWNVGYFQKIGAKVRVLSYREPSLIKNLFPATELPGYVTNAWRAEFEYGKNIQLAADKLVSAARYIHWDLPLPYGVSPIW